MKDWAYRTIKREVLDKLPSPRLGVLGLAYKQDTHSTKNSAALALIDRLQAAQLAVHDPAVPASAVPQGRWATDAVEVADGADAVLLMTPWPQYRDIDPAALASRMNGRIVVDPYRLLDVSRAAAAGLTIFSIGRAPVRPTKV
jgi:UDPglucose 6-dehydrogenase